MCVCVSVGEASLVANVILGLAGVRDVSFVSDPIQKDRCSARFLGKAFPCAVCISWAADSTIFPNPAVHGRFQLLGRISY